MKRVKQMYRQGIEKPEIFADAKARGLDPIKVSQFLRRHPDQHVSKSLNTLNLAFIVIYLALSAYILFLMVGAMLGQTTDHPVSDWALIAIRLLIVVTVVYGMLIKQASAYIFLVLIWSFVLALQMLNYKTLTMAGWVMMGIDGSLLIFLIVLKLKLFPFQSFFNMRRNEIGLYYFTTLPLIEGRQANQAS